MDLSALLIFKTVVEQGGINKAAAKLNRVPSNVTTRVKQLEQDLGVKLFEREGRGLAISADGRILLGDPSSGTRAITREHFEAIWPSRLLFVIHDAPNKPQFNLTADWRAAPRAPLGDAVSRTGIDYLGLPKFGPTDF